MDSFSNNLNRFKILNFSTVRGPSPPVPPALGPSEPFPLDPPPNQNPGAASGDCLFLEINHLTKFKQCMQDKDMPISIY